eukprot:COSAG05_NODE_60_length_23142_cov_25.372130_4_plen_184_part_00
MGRKQREKTGARKVAKGTPGSSATHHMTQKKHDGLAGHGGGGLPAEYHRTAKKRRGNFPKAAAAAAGANQATAAPTPKQQPPTQRPRNNWERKNKTPSLGQTITMMFSRDELYGRSCCRVGTLAIIMCVYIVMDISSQIQLGRAVLGRSNLRTVSCNTVKPASSPCSSRSRSTSKIAWMEALT